MVWVTKSMSGLRIASSTEEKLTPERHIFHRPAFSTVLTANLRSPQAPDREPRRVGGPDEDQPQGRGEEPGQHIRRIVHPEVESAKADQEHQQDPEGHDDPPRVATQPVSQYQGQCPVEPNRDGGVPAREGGEGGFVPRLEDLRSRPLEDGLEDGCQQRPADGRDRSEEHTSELQSPCNLVCRLLLEKK